ncbi:MAG: hypothetical protein ACRDZU_06545 [Acidimicrobiales bacterium]
MTAPTNEAAPASGRDARGWPARLVLVACALTLAGAALRVAVHDPTDQPVSGDQASFTYQALSLLGGDLAFDASDQKRWLELGWADQPHGLFVQRRDDGWAFAKPLGYSVLLAPAMAVADARGISLVGAALVLAYAGCWYGLGRLRWDRPAAVVVATVATVASHAWLFGFPAHADLFVAVLVGLAALGAARVAWRSTAAFLGSPTLWLTLAAVTTGLLVTEKLPALIALTPLLMVAFVRAPGRARVIAAVAGVAAVAVSVGPYLYYSDGASWSAYGGDRYYAIATTPWSGGTADDLTPWHTRDSLSPSFVLDSLEHPSDDLASATLTYAVGRHTGVATFLPIVPALFAAAVVARWRHRRTPSFSAHPAPPSGGESAQNQLGVAGPDRTVALAAAAGLAAYVGLYLIVFTDNYFGGGQSVGNRYFLQVSLLVPVVATASGVTSRAARWCGAAAVVWALVVLGAQLRHPEEAFYRIERTSAAQRALPFDGSQVHAWRFQCEPAECVPPPLEAFGEG